MVMDRPDTHSPQLREIKKKTGERERGRREKEGGERKREDKEIGRERQRG